jgi:CRP-like cAMP-binding protein
MLALNIIEIMSERLRKANAQIEALSFMNAHSRVLYNLIHMAARGPGKAGDGNTAVAPRLSQSEMANLCGVSRQAVNKVFTELRRGGLIEITQKHVRIPDVDALCRLILK